MPKDRQIPSWCCQRCGEQIGYLGRFIWFVFLPVLWMVKSIYHDCPGLFTHPPKKISQRESYERGNNFPIFDSSDSTAKERYDNP